MSYNCEFCKKSFSTKSIIKTHQKSAKYCLIIQNKPIEDKFKCDGCGKKFTTLLHINRHMEVCKTIEVTFNLREKVKFLENNMVELQEYKSKYLTLLKESVEQKEQYETKIQHLQDKLENIAIKAVEKTNVGNKYDIGWLEEIIIPEKLDTPYNKIKKENQDFKAQIKYLINKCVKKQPRIQYKEKYVIYLLTTDLMKKERRYILGKAKDLTSRLSTYNKSDEHEVVYYQSCGNQETMACVENMVFEYLKKYREQANREIFILPEKEDVKLFITAINKSVEFFK